MNVTIYSLTCPISNEVKYIGRTKQGLKTRLANHVCSPSGRKTKVWIAELKKQNKVPVIEALDIVPKSQMDYYEKFWIEQMRQWGFTLLNGDQKGKRGTPHTETITFKASPTLRMRLNQLASHENRTLSSYLRIHLNRTLK